MEQEQQAATAARPSGFTFSRTASRLLALGQVLVMFGFISAGTTLGEAIGGTKGPIARALLAVSAVAQFLMVPIVFVALGRVKHMR